MTSDYRLYRLSKSDQRNRRRIIPTDVGNHAPFHAMTREKSLAQLLIDDEIDVDFETVWECYELGGGLETHMLRRWVRQQMGVTA